MKIKAFDGTFVKKNGDERNMRFVKMDDLSDSFKITTLKGGAQRKLSPDFEVVWDLDAKGYRTYNWSTSKIVESFEIDENELLV